MKSRKALEALRRGSALVEKRIETAQQHLWEIQFLAQQNRQKDIWQLAKKALACL